MRSLTSSVLRLAPLCLVVAVSTGATGCATSYSTAPVIGALGPRAVVFVEGQGVVTGSDLECGPGDGDQPREQCSSAQTSGDGLTAKAASGWRFDHWEVKRSTALAHVEVKPGAGPVFTYMAVFAPAPENVASDRPSFVQR